MGKMKAFIGVIALAFCQTTFADIIYDTGLPNNAQWRNSDFSNQFVDRRLMISCSARTRS